MHEVDIERNADGSIRQESPQYYRTIRPTIPPVRTSHDGRIGFNWTNRNLYLLMPEKITRPFPFSESGLSIVGDLNGYYSQIEDLLTKDSDRNQPGYFVGSVFCNSKPITEQPKRCNGSNDCYEMSYLSFRLNKSAANPKSNFDHAYFRSRKIIVEVQNPKTLQARIIAVRSNGPIKEKAQPIEVDYSLTDASFSSLEPAATADGRLYVARAGFGGIEDGRLHWNSPRIDFQQNAFCLSCHSSEGSRGLHLSALTAGQQCAMKDSRRQPLQGPLYLSGSSTELQLWGIAQDHQSKPKLYSPEGSLLLDPMVLSSKAGASCE